MKLMMRRSFGSVVMVAAAFFVGLAAVPFFAGADALELAKSSLFGDAAETAYSVDSEAQTAIASMLTETYRAARNKAALDGAATHACPMSKGADSAAKAAHGACSASTADVAAKTEAVDAKIAKVATDVPACCADKAVGGKAAKMTEAAPAACTAEKSEAVAKTDAADPKIAKVAGEETACCADEAAAAKAVAKVEETAKVPECCLDHADKPEASSD